MTTATVIDQMRAERHLAPGEVWKAAESRLARHPSEGLNTAYEACDRWSDDHSRIAVVVRHPDGKPAEYWTYAEMSRASSRLATALSAGGVTRGDRVAILLPQGIEAHLAALAVWRMGAVLVPMYPGFGAEGLLQRLRGSSPTVIIVDHASRANLDSALSGSDIDPILITVGHGSEKPRPAGEKGFWELIDRHDALVAPLDTAANETATLIYTSGTTGQPKGCLLPHSYLLTMQPFVRHSFALGESDLLAATSSPGWVNGLYSVGACVSAEGRPRVIYTGRFDAAGWVELIREEGVTYLSSTPSALRHLLPVCAETGFPGTLRGGASAGEHQGAELAAIWSRYCSEPLRESYGTTEIGLVMAARAFDPTSYPQGALPAALPGFEIALMDDAGNVQEDLGIIAVRNPAYPGCTGYLDAEDKWAARWRGEWFLTGDLARRDEDGQLWFQGRDDDLIITSGYNVGPTEVEAIVFEHPDVKEVAVVSAPDEVRGSVVRAVVVASPDADQQRLRAEITGAVRTKLGRHVYPRIIDFVDELPRNPAGKVLRNVLRDSYTSQVTS